MVLRKINHNKKILSTKPINISKVEFPNIIQFRYDSKNDMKPLVFVLKIKNKILDGININFLKDTEIVKLLQEKNFKKLNNWSIYQESYRTYSTKKIKSLKLVEFDFVSGPKKPQQPKKPEGGINED
tara:strand:+ start:327 stop:707 length:381 start_codon:yes stop_codon:yes gene_type:complete